MNSEDRTKIVERIQQLLAMAADTSSPNEAAIAAGRARKLMDKHQIDLGDLKKEDGFGFKPADKGYRYMPEWKSWLSVGIAKFNDCKVILTHEWHTINKSYSKRLVFQGFESDAILAVQMYDYLTATVDRLCAIYIQQLGYNKYPAKIGDSYKKAAATTLCARLKEMLAERQKEFVMSTGTSLVIYKMHQVEAHFGAANYSTSRARTRIDMDTIHARERGAADARNISLARQVSSNDDAKRLS